MNEETNSRSRGRFYLPTKLAKMVNLLSMEERGMILTACLDYYDKGEVSPCFEDRSLQIIWEGDLLPFFTACDRQYIEICQRNANNRLKGLTSRHQSSPVVTSGRQSSPVVTDIDIDIDIDNDIDIEEKKTAPPAVASGANAASGVSISHRRSSFKTWTESDLIASIDDCIRQTPEYAPFKDDFARYWGEPMANGKPRVCGEKCWETPRRMATWQRRADEYGSSGRTGRPPAGQPDGIENLFEQAKKTTR